MGFKSWLETAVMDRRRVSTGIGSPPEPPFNDEGDNDDEAEWSWDNVLSKYSKVIQSWLDIDAFAKKCKGAVLGHIFKTQPQHEISIPSEHEDRINPQDDAELTLEWSYPEGNLPSMVFQAMRNASQCSLWKVLGVRPEDWFSTIDKGDLFDVVWHFFAMSLAGTSLPILLHPQGDASHRLGLNSQWMKDKITLSKYAEFMVKTREAEYEQWVKDEVHDHWVMSKNPPPREIKIQWLGNKSDGRYWKDVFTVSVRVQYWYSVIS